MTGSTKTSRKKPIQCKNCKETFILFMSHLKKKIDCQRAYGAGYKRMLELNAKKRRQNMKEYNKKKKEEIQAKKSLRKHLPTNICKVVKAIRHVKPSYSVKHFCATLQLNL